MTIYC